MTEGPAKAGKYRVQSAECRVQSAGSYGLRISLLPDYREEDGIKAGSHFELFHNLSTEFSSSSLAQHLN